MWPYLLGHHKFGSSPEEREGLEQAVRTEYEKIMSEWLAVEAIIRQRDKEVIAANLAKLSQESTDGHIPLVRKDSSLSNEVWSPYQFFHMFQAWVTMYTLYCCMACVHR